MGNDVQLMIRVSSNALRTIEYDANTLRTTKSDLLNTVIKNYASTFIKQKKRTVREYEKYITSAIHQIKAIEPNTNLSQKAIKLLASRMLSGRWNEQITIDTLYDGDIPRNNTASLEKKYKREAFRFRLRNDVASLKILPEGYQIFNDDKSGADKNKPTAKLFNALFEQYAKLTEYNRHILYYWDRINMLAKYSDLSKTDFCPYLEGNVITYGLDITRTWLLRPFRITTSVEDSNPSLLAFTTFSQTGDTFLLVKIPLWRIKSFSERTDITKDARLSTSRIKEIEKFMHGPDSTLLDDDYDTYRVLFTDEGVSAIDRVKSFIPERGNISISNRTKDLRYEGKEYSSVRYYNCSRRQLHWYLGRLSPKYYAIDISDRGWRGWTYKANEYIYKDILILTE